MAYYYLDANIKLMINLTVLYKFQKILKFGDFVIIFSDKLNGCKFNHNLKHELKLFKGAYLQYMYVNK